MQPLGGVLSSKQLVWLVIRIIDGIAAGEAIEATHDDETDVARTVAWRRATRRRHRQEIDHIFSRVLLWCPGTTLEEPAQGARIITHGMRAVGVRDKDILEVGGDTVLPEQA